MLSSQTHFGKRGLLVARQSTDGGLLHFVAVRYRVTGVGVLRSNLRSLDEVTVDPLPNITLSAATNREPTILANYTEQRAFLEGKTINIDETFAVSKIVVFAKPSASGYPQ